MLSIKAQAAKQKILNVADVADLVKKVEDVEGKKKNSTAVRVKKLNIRHQTRQQTITIYDEYSNKINLDDHKMNS